MIIYISFYGDLCKCSFLVIHVLAKARVFFSVFAKKAVVFSDNFALLPLLAALSRAVLRVALVGWREGKASWDTGGGWLVGVVRTVGYRPAQSFPVSFQRVTNSDFHLPCLSASASSFLFHFSAVPRGRGAVLYTQAHLRAAATPAFPL